MAAVGLATLIPTTPGAVGVAEVAYIGFLTGVTGPGQTDQLTAAILIFRAFQWLAPIPIGWILLVIMRGEHWREIAQVSGGPVTPTADARVANGAGHQYSSCRRSQSCHASPSSAPFGAWSRIG